MKVGFSQKQILNKGFEQVIFFLKEMIPEETSEELGETGKGKVRNAKQGAVSRLVLCGALSVACTSRFVPP